MEWKEGVWKEGVWKEGVWVCVRERELARPRANEREGRREARRV